MGGSSSSIGHGYPSFEIRGCDDNVCTQELIQGSKGDVSFLGARRLSFADEASDGNMFKQWYLWEDFLDYTRIIDWSRCYGG